MSAPLLPADEASRLSALRRYEILDTLPDQVLDDIAALAARICEAPICLISLVDRDRQWFKSTVGLSLGESPRDVSFCGQAILESDLMVVHDAATDERFVGNPLVTGEPGVRFYAGAQLMTPAGQALGTLCVMDRVPRDLTALQGEALRVLSHQVMAHLEVRRQARELVESEARLLQIFRNSPVALCVHRWPDRTFVDVNAAFTDLLGWTRDEVVGRTASELHIVEAEASTQIRSRLDEAVAMRDVELAVRTRTGEQRLVLLGAERLDLRGEPHLITTFVDITARKQAELESPRLAAIVESSDDAIIGMDLSGMITSWNGGAARLFGYSSAEIVGTPSLRLIPEDRWDEERDVLATVKIGDGVKHLETLRLTKDGQPLDVSVTTSPIRDASGTVVGVSKVARDISERKRVELALRASEFRYRALFEHAPDGILIADPESYYIDANAAMCRMLGYSREQLVGMHGADIVAPEEVQHIAPALASIREGPGYHREWTFRRMNGSTFPGEVIVTPMPDGNLLAMVRDATERRRSEARFRRLVNSNAQGVMFWSATGLVTGANDALLRIVGYTREDLEAGRINWMTMTPPEYAAADGRSVAEMAATGVCTPFEKEYLRRDGARVPVLVGAATFEDNPDEGVAFVLDLTEPKKFEKQLFRAQRMESIGTLAAGIAHDLNNVLAPILLSVQLLREEITNPILGEYLETLQHSAERGAALARQVLSFARGVDGQHIKVNPAHLFRDLLTVMRDTFPKSIDVRLTAAPDLWTIVGDPTQVYQVFLNLCVNARDAMPHGGTLTIAMENVTLDETYAAMNIDSHPGEYVRVKVADTGTGIAPEVQERMFEPFFTTKEIGQGTGLGLSTSLAIVKSHGGFIHAYSEVGQGTKFYVYLVANSSELAVDLVAGDGGELPRGHGELVLVVDDEKAIRDIALATLKRFGYRVMLAGNGAEAVALYAQHRSEIAIVLTDMAMPIMDGPTTIVALKAIDPAVKIVGSSGFASNAAVMKAMSAGVRLFVSKPYTAETLLKALRELLAE